MPCPRAKGQLGTSVLVRTSAQVLDEPVRVIVVQPDKVCRNEGVHTTGGHDCLKRRFSELAREAFCNQEYARALKQRLDDEPEPIIAQSEAPVLKHPGVAALDRPAPLAQSRSGRLATLVDLGCDTEEAA